MYVNICIVKYFSVVSIQTINLWNGFAAHLYLLLDSSYSWLTPTVKFAALSRNSLSSLNADLEK